MNAEELARLEALEAKVNALKSALDALLAIAEARAAVAPEDPVYASFLRFQQNADRQMGRSR